MELCQRMDIVSGFVPVDMQTAANPTDYVCLKNWRRAHFILYKGIGTAAQDPVLTFTQATEVAGSTTKAASIITKYYYKQDTDLTSAATTWSTATQAASQTVTLNATSAESQGIYVFTIEADQLDVDNGYDCINCSVADVGGNAQLGCMLILLEGPRFAQATLPDPVID